MEKPETIVGFQICRAVVDELDILNRKKAELCWRKIQGRMRQNIDGLNQRVINVATTPEGYKFVYERFKKNPKSKYSMVQCSTYENEDNLPSDYISNLKEDYPEQLIDAYLRGQFVNLNGKPTYYNFCRNRNNSTEEYINGEDVFIGQDFNIGKMASVVFVKRGDSYHAINELIGGLDTESTCQSIKELYSSSDVTFFPDASGNSRKTSAKNGNTDFKIIKSYGFSIKSDKTNPRIQDRVTACNAGFKNANGVIQLFVNVNRCPKLTEGLEQQVNDDNSLPVKDNIIDHGNDAFGYFAVKSVKIHSLRKQTQKVNEVIDFVM